MLERPDPYQRAGRVFGAFLVTLILLNVASVIYETVPASEPYRGALFVFDVVSLAIFSLEYVVRLWTCVEDPRYAAPVRGRLRWAATPYAVIDLLAIAPGLLRFLDLRFLRALRLLRLFKIGRYSDSLAILTTTIKRRADQLGMAAFIVAVALIVTSSFMYYAERDHQPDVFGSIPRAMWWGVVALTTTGYGDVVPVTDAGKILGGITALLGICAIALPVGILASGFQQEIEARRAITPAPPEGTCPHCGRPHVERRG